MKSLNWITPLLLTSLLISCGNNQSSRVTLNNGTTSLTRSSITSKLPADRNCRIRYLHGEGYRVFIGSVDASANAFPTIQAAFNFESADQSSCTISAESCSITYDGGYWINVAGTPFQDTPYETVADLNAAIADVYDSTRDHSSATPPTNINICKVFQGTACSIVYNTTAKLYYVQRMNAAGVMENFEPHGFKDHAIADAFFTSLPLSVCAR